MKLMSRLEEARILNLQKIGDSRGQLSFVEADNPIPFEMKRTYWVYDVPGGERRGAHAFKKNREFIIALSGSFDVTLSDGRQTRTFSLNRSYYGLYVPEGLWKVMDNFSTNSLALIVASEEYDEDDYLLDYDKWQQYLTAH